MDYADYQHLRFEPQPNGVLCITLDRPPVNATDARMHWELTEVWKTIDADAAVRVALVTGAGKAFSAGGDISLLEDMAGNAAAAARTLREAADIVYNMINLDKPIISAINGVAVGAGLAVALMADISIIAETARFTDGHLRLGVGAGDHAAIIWPLLCGMAKAKYYLMTAEFIDGTRGRAHRPGQPVRAGGAADGQGLGGRQPARRPARRTRCVSPSARSTTGCASPAPIFDTLAGLRDAQLHGARRARGHRRAAGEAPAALPVGALRRWARVIVAGSRAQQPNCRPEPGPRVTPRLSNPSFPCRVAESG